jgi:hypothetical protein
MNANLTMEDLDLKIDSITQEFVQILKRYSNFAKMNLDTIQQKEEWVETLQGFTEEVHMFEDVLGVPKET